MPPSASCTEESCRLPITDFPERYRTAVNAVIGNDNEVNSLNALHRAADVTERLFKQDMLDRHGSETDPTKPQISDTYVTVRENEVDYRYLLEKPADLYAPMSLVKVNLSTGDRELTMPIPETYEIASDGQAVFLAFTDGRGWGQFNGSNLVLRDADFVFTMTMGWMNGLMLIPDTSGDLQICGFNVFGEKIWCGSPTDDNDW